MMAMLDRWLDLPIGARVAMVLLGGGGIASAAALAIGDARVFLFVGLGLALVGSLALGYQWLLKRRKAKRSKPFEKQIAGSGAATPREVSDPTRRAHIDSMRKKFEEGLRVYRQRGKDLYSVPWYVVIGEPASGKSAAIRHSGVGFPPGLTSEMQGVGGTLNMDWFFTNDAVILDTAGRLAFEEVDTSKTTEWQEFLRLLRLARPRCPINGMLLFIPVDSLKSDTADELERKAKKISQQLDFVQQTLGVRFPLSVVVSKADLLVGFSEFFEGMADPREQHQIFGWSNPKPLDQNFRPEEVGDALRAIRERVVRRRTLLLKEPAPQSLEADRRIDEVDRLFLLPDEIKAIEPRLKRYMDLCFAGGQWASPPPFLRGVYFTSALREGEAVDLALAEAIGVDAADMQERRSWDKARSFFLHDVFVEKVFRERGLVTAAPSPGRAKRKRRTLLWGAVSAILLLATGLAIASAYQFYLDLKKPALFYDAVRPTAVAQSGGPGKIQIIETQGGEKQYLGAEPLGDSTLGSRATLASRMGERRRQSSLRPGGMFAVFRALLPVFDLEDAQVEAQRAVFDVSIAEPLLRESIGRLSSAADVDWSDESATATLAAVLDAWTRSQGFENSVVAPPPDAEPGEGAAASSQPPVLPLAELGAFALADLSEELRRSFEQDLPAMQQAMADVYGGNLRDAWPPEHLDLDDRDLKRAADRFVEWWTVGRASPKAAALIALADTAQAFHEAEDALLKRSWFEGVDTPEAFGTERDAWKASLATLEQRTAELDAAIQTASAAGITMDGDWASVRETAVGEAGTRLRAVFGQVLSALPAQSPAGDNAADGAAASAVTPPEMAQTLRTRLEALTAGLATGLQQDTATLDDAVRRSLASTGGQSRYTLRVHAYRKASEALASSEDAAWDSERLLDQAGAIEEQRAAFVRGYESALGQGAAGAEGLHARVSGVCGAVVDAGVGFSRYRIADGLLKQLEPGDLGALAASGAEPTALDAIAVRDVEITDRWEVEARFDPEGAGRLFESWGWLDGAVNGSPPVRMIGRGAIGRRLAAAAGSLDSYAGGYQAAWSKQVSVKETLRWSDFKSVLPVLSARDTNNALEPIAKARSDALNRLPVSLLEESRRAGARQEIAEAKTAYESLLQGEFDDQGGKVRDAWSDLPHDAARARLALLSLKPGTLTDDYLVHSSEAARAQSLGFWDSLTDRMMGAIARESQSSFSQAWSELGAVNAGAPFCRGGADAGRVDYSRVVAAIDGMLGAETQEQRGGEFAQGTLGAGGSSGIGAIDQLLRALREADGGLDADERARLTKVRAIASWLGGDPTVRLYSIDGGLYPPGESWGSKRGVSLGDGGSQSTSFEQPLDETQPPGDPRPVELTGPLSFRYWDAGTGGNAIGEPVALEAPWGLLELLWEGKVTKATVQSDVEVWVVPLPSSGGNGTVWIGLEFSEKLPVEPSAWPKCGNGD